MRPESGGIDLNELLHSSLEFDVQAAFMGAVSDIVSNEILSLDEKFARTEFLMGQARSDVYRDLVDVQAIANMAMECASHMHGQIGAEMFSGLFKPDNHDDAHHHSEREGDEDDGETDKKKSKKKPESSQPIGWLALTGKR
jgi:hypothetical protein